MIDARNNKIKIYSNEESACNLCGKAAEAMFNRVKSYSRR